MAKKQAVGKKTLRKIEALLTCKCHAAFANGDLPNGVYLAYVGDNVYFVNLRKQKVRCYIRQGKFMMHKARVINKIPVEANGKLAELETEVRLSEDSYKYHQELKAAVERLQKEQRTGMKPISQINASEEIPDSFPMFDSEDVVEVTSEEREQFLNAIYKEPRQEKNVYRWDSDWSCMT